MAALLNSLMAVNTNNRHLVWRLRTKLDSASTANKDSKHYKRASNIQKYKCIQPGIEANNRHLVWRLRTKLDSASTVNKDSKHYKRASNIQKYKCIQPGIEASLGVDRFPLSESCALYGHLPVSRIHCLLPCFNPFTLRAAKTGLTILIIFFLTKAFFGKYLKEKCSSEYYQQLSFKYFMRICFISKLFSKVWK